MIPHLGRDHSTKSARQTFAMNWYKMFQGDIENNPKKELVKQVELFTDWITSQVVWTDRDEVFVLLLRGIEEGIHRV